MSNEKINIHGNNESNLTSKEGNEQIKKDFELAQKAKLNLEFGGGIHETDDGSVYTKIADVFEREAVKGLSEGQVEVSEVLKQGPVRFFVGTPEAQQDREEAIILAEKMIEKIRSGEAAVDVFLYESEKIDSEYPRGGRERDKKMKSLESLNITILNPLSPYKETKDMSSEDREQYLAVLEASRMLLRDPEKFEEFYKVYDNWGKENFDPKFMPSENDPSLDRFDLEVFLELQLIRKQEAIKEKIQQSAFVSKALTCLESYQEKEGHQPELRVREGKEKLVSDIREAYAQDVNPETISLLMIGSGILFKEVPNDRGSDTHADRSGRSRSARAVDLIVGEKN